MMRKSSSASTPASTTTAPNPPSPCAYSKPTHRKSILNRVSSGTEYDQGAVRVLLSENNWSPMDSLRIEFARSATKDLRGIDRKWILRIITEI